MLLLTALGSLASIKAAVDELDRHDPSPAEAVSWFEENPGRFRLEVYAPTQQDSDSACAIIGAAAPDLHMLQSEVAAADWVAMSLEGLPPVRAGRFFVAGAHVLQRAAGGRKRIWIEASEAFGTGHHGTTWGCLVGLEHFLRTRQERPPPNGGRVGWGGVQDRALTAPLAVPPARPLPLPPPPGAGDRTFASRYAAFPSRGGGFSVLDVGTGSGVLAIAAAKAGGKALAIEIDRRAAAIAAINAKQNKRAVRVIAGDGARFTAGKQFDLVFANILMRPLIRLAPRLAPAVKPGGTLILSGLLREQAPLIRAAYSSRGLVLERMIPKEAWMTLLWRKR